MLSSFFQMAQSGNTNDMLKYAQNLFNQNGRDFNSEFSNFIKMVKPN
jgi:hypothetical protein